VEFRKTDSEIDSKNYRIIHLDEESIGLTNLNKIKEAIEEEISAGNNYIGLDLQDVTTINSSGLGILISCLKLIKTKNGDLKLLNANDKLYNVFKITKLNNVFSITKSA